MPIKRWKDILSSKLPPAVQAKVSAIIESPTCLFSEMRTKLLETERLSLQRTWTNLFERHTVRRNKSHRDWFHSRLTHISRMFAGCKTAEEYKLRVAICLCRLDLNNSNQLLLDGMDIKTNEDSLAVGDIFDASEDVIRQKHNEGQDNRHCHHRNLLPTCHICSKVGHQAADCWFRDQHWNTEVHNYTTRKVIDKTPGHYASECSKHKPTQKSINQKPEEKKVRSVKVNDSFVLDGSVNGMSVPILLDTEAEFQ